MKKILNMKCLVTCFALAGAFMLQSCEEEETFDVIGTTENKVYLNTRTGGTLNIPKNSFVFDVANTPIGSFIANTNKLEVSIAAQCTHKAANDITVKFEVDNSLIMDGYAVLPANVPLKLEKTEVVIPRGEIISNDKLVVSIDSADLGKLEATTYMVPIKVASASNTALSTNLITAYVIINTIETNVYSFTGVNDMVGSLVTPRTGWTGHATLGLTSGSFANMFNTTTTTFWRIDPGNQIYDWWVDMVSVHIGITGIRIHVNNAAYNFTRLHIYSSKDGENWTSEGITDMTIGAAYQYIKFYAPVDAQYLKFTVLGRRHASQTRVAIFDIYKQ